MEAELRSIRPFLFGLLLCAAGSEAFGQSGEHSDPSSEFRLSLNPGLSIPLGDSAPLFSFGGGLDLDFEYRPKIIPAARFLMILQYDLIPIQADTTVSLLSAGLGAGAGMQLFRDFSAECFASGGYYYGFLNDSNAAAGLTQAQSSGSNPFVGGGLRFTWMANPVLGFSLGGTYRALLGFSQDVRVYLGIVYDFVPVSQQIEGEIQLKPTPLKGLTISNIELETVFPVFQKYYDDHPLGHAVIANQEGASLENLKVTFSVPQYMIQPKEARAESSLKPGAKSTVDIFGLFTENILSVSENTKVAAMIVVEGECGGKRFRNEQPISLNLYDRNAIRWDDDRKVAAFVSYKDPPVLKFSKNTAAAVKDKTSASLDPAISAAVALHEALRLHGLRYAVDPSTPYDSASAGRIVDYVQFPRQTLEYKGGDCDDLSVLYCALAESLGIESAFITVPGHIFIALRLEADAETAKSQFLRPEDLIFKDDKAWLPIEVTQTAGGFLEAWTAGAEQWRSATAKGQAGFTPVHVAWETYESVGLPAVEKDLGFPDPSALAEAYLLEIKRYVDRELGPRVTRLEQEIRAAQESPQTVNKLGVLYARFGRYDSAEKEFRRILAKGDYTPALVNLANILYVKRNLSQALDLYQRALKLKPEEVMALLGYARVSYEMENYGTAASAYKRLAAAAPGLAERYSYLESREKAATRAAETLRTKEEMVWDE
jgi:tetratricopeptide (TPR) repeat protein